MTGKPEEQTRNVVEIGNGDAGCLLWLEGDDLVWELYCDGGYRAGDGRANFERIVSALRAGKAADFTGWDDVRKRYGAERRGQE